MTPLSGNGWGATLEPVGGVKSPTLEQKRDFLFRRDGGGGATFQPSPTLPTPAQATTTTPGMLTQTPTQATAAGLQSPAGGGGASGAAPPPPAMPGAAGGYNPIGAMGMGMMSPFLAMGGVNPSVLYGQGGMGGGAGGGLRPWNARPMMAQSPYSLNPYINALRG